MAVSAYTYVWENSKQSGSKLVVMLALADYANPETGECWPSVETLAEKCRMTTRYLRTILNALQKDGEVKRIHGAGQRTETGATNRYVICGYQEWIKQVKALKREGVNNDSPHDAQGVNNGSARGEQEFRQGVNNGSVNPLVEPSKKRKKNQAPVGAAPDTDPASYAEWMEFINKEFKIGKSAPQARDTYNMFKGRAQRDEWKEHNITPPASLDEVKQWVAYEKRKHFEEHKTAEFVYRKATTVNAKFLYWRERKAAIEAERQRDAEFERLTA